MAATVADRGIADYYAFNVSNGEGFVIVAADDRVKPILAYYTTGHFDPDRVSDGFQFTLDAFCDEIHYVREHNLSATPDIIAEWESVCQARAVVGQGQLDVSHFAPGVYTIKVDGFTVRFVK